MTLPDLTFNVQSQWFTADEQALANELGTRLQRQESHLQLLDDYYEGQFRVRHLGIAVPENLQTLRTVIGWPRLAVDTLDERLDIGGFVLPGADSTDQDLWDIWLANAMDQQSQFSHVDALVFGHGIVIGGGRTDEDYPLVTVESPQNMVVDFDAVTGRVRDGLQVYEFDGDQYVALYVPNSTVHLVKPENGPWQLASRDDHNLGRPPVVLLPNRTRTSKRYGCSEITPEVMYLNDAACRTLLGMEISREFFAAQQRYILGASEDAFVDADGKPLKAWETYIGWILSLERDTEGNVPSVGTFPAQSPEPFVALVQDYSRRFAAVTGLPPHMVGYSADNPASADGIRSAEARLDKRALRKQANFTPGWRDVALLIMEMAKMPVPDQPYKLKVDWRDPSTPTELETAQSVFYEVQMGYLPAESDMVGQRLGYSATERAAIAADRKRARAAGALDAITQRMQNKNGGAPNGDLNPAQQQYAAGPGDVPELGVRGPGGGIPRIRLGAGRG